MPTVFKIRRKEPQSGSFEVYVFNKSLTNANRFENQAKKCRRGRPATEGTAGEPKVRLFASFSMMGCPLKANTKNKICEIALLKTSNLEFLF